MSSDRDIRTTLFDPAPSFEVKAARVFRYQYENNRVFRTYVDATGFNLPAESSPSEFPLLPVRAFKETRLTSRQASPPLVFRSSGTSGMVRSVHEIHDPSLYEQSVVQGFARFYPGDPVIWACTPGYSENPDSSLIRMLQILIERDGSGLSRFLEQGRPLDPALLAGVQGSGRQLILFGAAFGLLDLADLQGAVLPTGSRVIETGGMKTRRREMSRKELHKRLSDRFGLPEQNIDSEYGMSELLSQAYARGDEWFECVPWMQVTIRNPDDPREVLPSGEEGKIGVIDLANLYSCSFLLTEDRGVAGPQGKFNVLGRWNPENLRGCNFLIDRD